MKKAKSVAIASCLALALALPSAALAADTHSKSGVIFQYGPDGGVTFSVNATTSSILDYSTATVGNRYEYTYTKSDASIQSDSSYGLSNCSSSMNVRNTTNFNGSSVSLSQPSSYWVGPNTTIIGKNSGNGWKTSLVTNFDVSVDNEGYVYPSPSACFGGGAVTDSFTVSH
ncbi:hypothetical protein [Paenibacillus sp.]|jgi:hypothetical protein|uniref:hypothetical protein n=1 Tax=Paenibacillus sp. TaxID=58172 RepID=UPI002825C491|nr:hypothetical protein [Paenibacillus sp.]MDR0267082.1 hypothetical protein [Paenibacillus sp.]